MVGQPLKNAEAGTELTTKEYRWPTLSVNTSMNWGCDKYRHTSVDLNLVNSVRNMVDSVDFNYSPDYYLSIDQ